MHWPQLVRFFRRPDLPFDFPEIPASSRLAYELLTAANAAVLATLFRDDPSPFIDPDFRNEEGCRQYLARLLEYHHFSPLQGGADWFFKTADGKYAGILHLYHLSRQTRGGRHRQCTIGFATVPDVRRQGLATEALTHFSAFIFRHYRLTVIRAYTRQENEPTRNLLRKAGFQPDKKEYADERFAYFILRSNQKKGWWVFG